VPELQFQVEDVSPRANAATPQLTFKLRVTNTVKNEAVQSMLLRCQLQIEPVRRRYTPQEQQRMLELFGEPERWSKTLRPLLWENLTISVPGFSGDTVLELFVPCSFDFNIAMTKYAYGLEGGELPTSLLFSGTVFFQGRVGLQIMQIPWSSEARYSVPVQVWRQMMDTFYPDYAWIALRRESFDQLYDYKTRHGIPSWEQVIERMLNSVTEVKS
jgi:Family of unknown function (DUF6084)